MDEKSPENIKCDIRDVSTINPEVLRTLPYEYSGKEIIIRIETDEFGAVCPWSGLPDFGTLFLEYIPDKVIIELKSFKYYLYSFRSVGIIQEHALNRIYDDLIKLLKPKWMKMTLTYHIRGGLKTTVIRENKD